MKQVSALILALAFAGSLLPSANAQPNREKGDGSSIRDSDRLLNVKRFSVPKKDAPNILQKLSRGAYGRLSLSDFERRMKNATNWLQNPGKGPRLHSARYWAKLVGGGLKGGGDLTVHSGAKVPALFDMSDLGLAINAVKISGKPAVIGVFDGKSPGLLVEKTGKHSVFFDWSLMGNQTKDESHFAMQIPACAENSLELTIPENYVVSVSSAPDVLLTGPHFAGNAAFQMWRLRFSGKSKIDFTLHRIQGPEAAAPLLLSTVTTQQKILPNRLDAEYVFDIEAMQNAVSELLFEWDGPMRPVQVWFPNLGFKGWEIKKLAGPNKSNGNAASAASREILSVRLRQPLRGRLPPLHVRCMGLLAERGRWTSPRVQLRGALLVQETLHLNVHSAIQMEHWQAGSFRIDTIGTDKAGTKRITLTATGASNPVRPSAQLQVQKPRVAAEQQSWWRVGGTESIFLSDISFRTLQGPIHYLEILLPKDWKDGWQMESVQLAPKLLQRGWVILPEKGRWLLSVELSRGLEKHEVAKLSLGLRRHFNVQSLKGKSTLDVPEIYARIIGPYSGSIGISIDPFFGGVLKSTGSLSPAPASDLWGKNQPAFYMSFRGKTISGKLQLRAQSPSFRARWDSAVMLRRNHAAIETKLQIEPLSGSLSFVDLYMTSPDFGDLQCKTAEGQRAAVSLARLPFRELGSNLAPLQAANCLQALVTQTVRPQGQWWRLKFEKAVKSHRTFILQARLLPSRPATGALTFWDVPLPIAKEADELEGILTVSAAGDQIARIEPQEMRNQTAADTNNVLKPAALLNARQLPVSYYYSSKSRPHRLPRLRLQSASSPPKHISQQQIEEAHLTTIVRPDADLIHRLVLDVAHWQNTAISLKLPRDAQIVHARVQGKRASSFTAVPDGDHLHVLLPADPFAQRQWFEVAYFTKSKNVICPLGGCVEIGPPELPLIPLVSRHIWRLAPGLAPVAPGSFRPVHLFARPAKGGLVEILKQSWNALNSLDRVLGQSPIPSQQSSRAHEAFALAMKKLHRKYKNQDIELADVLRELTNNRSGQFLGVMIDSIALQAAEVSPHTRLSFAGDDQQSQDGSQQAWNTVGIKVIPFARGVLITSNAQWTTWQRERPGNRLYSDIDAAAGDVFLYGTDKSDRFQSIFTWLDRRGAGTADGTPRQLSGRVLYQQETGWTDWEEMHGMPAETTMTFVSTSHVTIGACLVALVAALAGWFFTKKLNYRWRVRSLLIVMMGGILGVSWSSSSLQPLIWAPVITSAVAMLGRICLGDSAKSPHNNRVGHRRVAAAGISLLVLCTIYLFTSTAFGRNDTQYLVYLFDGTSGKAGDRQAFVPLELLRRLETIANQNRPTLPDAVIISADYDDGRVYKGHMQFTARLRLYCFSDRAIVSLPLDEKIQLREGTLLEGAPAFPIPAPGKQKGYVIPVNNRKGKFVNLVLPFRVPIQKQRDTYEFDFAIPRCVQNSLSLRLPKNSRFIQVLESAGLQKNDSDGEFIVVKSNLGLVDPQSNVSKVHVRWNGPIPGMDRPNAEVTESHLWKIRTPVSELTSVFDYQVKKGAISALSLQIPTNSHVRSVEVRHPNSGKSVTVPVALQRWRVVEKPREHLLEVELNAAATEGVQLAVNLICSTPLTKQGTELLLPAPVKFNSVGGVLAYSADNSELLDKANQISYVRMAAKSFAEHWQSLGMRRAENNVQAFRFRRNQARSLAGIRVVYAPAPRSAHQHIEWTLHPDYADLNAVLTIESARREIVLVEWDLPVPIVLADIRGDDLLDWNQFVHGSRNRLQVWLSRPRSKAQVHLKGWLAAGGKARNKTRWSPPRSQTAGRFVTDAFLPVSTGPCMTTVKVNVVHGLKTFPGPSKNVTLVSKGRELSYSSMQKMHSIVVAARRARIRPEVDTLLLARQSGSNIQITGWIFLNKSSGKIGRLPIQIKNWHGHSLRLVAPRAKVLARRKEGNDHSWVLSLSPGGTQRSLLKFHGILRVKKNGRIDLPSVYVPSAQWNESYVALADANLQLVEKPGIAPVMELPDQPKSWMPGLIDHRNRGRLWKIENLQARLQIRVKPVVQSPKIRVISAEQFSFLTSNKKWMHEGIFTFTVKPNSVITATLPYRAKLLSISLDGQAVVSAANEAGSFRFNTSPDSGMHILVVRWHFSDPSEVVRRPVLSSVRLEDADRHPMLWTVVAPPGYRLSAVAKNGKPLQCRVGVLESDVRRAEFLYRVSAVLAAKPDDDKQSERDQLAGAQQAFYWFVRQADSRLQTNEHLRDSADNGLRELAAHLAKLRNQNEILAKEFEFEQIRNSAESLPNLPHPWRIAFRPRIISGEAMSCFEELAATPPVFSLEREFPVNADRHWWITGLVFVAFVIGWVLCSFQFVLTLLRWTWPELIAGLTIMGFAAFGFSAIGLVLLLLAAAGRLTMLILMLQKLWRRWFRPAVASEGSS